MPVPRMHQVESTAVARIGYDSEAEEAYVEYLGGGLYAYEGVPADVFRGAGEGGVERHVRQRGDQGASVPRGLDGDAKDRVVEGDSLQLRLWRIGADAVEEGTGLPFPLLQVGAQQGGLLLVG